MSIEYGTTPDPKEEPEARKHYCSSLYCVQCGYRGPDNPNRMLGATAFFTCDTDPSQDPDSDIVSVSKPFGIIGR